MASPKLAALSLSAGERQVLEGWARRRKTAQALALRSRIVLACADGSANTRVAADLGVSRATVIKWRSRFLAERLEGLSDEPRPGAPRKITDEQVERVITRTLEDRGPGEDTHWSTRSMAAETGMSQTAVSRIWRAFGVKPHLIQTWKLSTDPQFIDKVRDTKCLRTYQGWRGSTPELAGFSACGCWPHRHGRDVRSTRSGLLVWGGLVITGFGPADEFAFRASSRLVKPGPGVGREAEPVPCRARSRRGEIVRHLPTEPLEVSALPPVTSRGEYEAARARLLVREKAHTREGDAIAAERRRLPMIEIPATVTVVGAKGEVPFLDVFDGRRMLAAYFHMWHDGEPWEGQCIGCTYFASQVQAPLAHLDARDVTLAYLCEGSYVESRGYADFMGYTAPWYSARDAGAGLLADRGFGWLGCYVRDDDDRVYETYWTTDRGNEAGFWSYALLDRTVFGRQEVWEDSPPGWPKIPAGQHQWRVDGRPLAQWDVTDEPVASATPLRRE